MYNPTQFSTGEEFFGFAYGDQKKGEVIGKAWTGPNSAANALAKAFTFEGVPVSSFDTVDGNTANGNYRNYIYGKQIWAQMNIRPTVFSAIARNQYVKSGYRIIKDFATSAIVPNAINEKYSRMPDVKNPTISSLIVNPREIVNDLYEMTLVQQALDGLDDTINFDAILEVLQNEFTMRVNGQMLMKNYDVGYDSSSSDPTVQALVNYGSIKAAFNAGLIPDPVGVPITSLDVLISGYNEYATQGYSGDAGAAAVDLFNMDRHTKASNMDAFVDCGTTTALRNVSADMLDNAVQQVMPYWKDNTMDNKVIITGFGTIGRIQQLHYQFQRFMGYGNYQQTYNGVRTCPGDVVGFGASAFKGIPLVPDKMVTGIKADGTGVEKMYGIDTNTIHHAILIPPTFIQDKSYIPRRSLADVATYYMASEMVCTKPRANFKIMNLQ